MRDYEELYDAVTRAGGLLPVTMGTLRDIENAGRLGKIVRDRISTNLRHHRLRHLPLELPNDQNDVVRVYADSGTLAAVVDAVLRPSEQGDRLLKELATKGSKKKLNDLRVLLEEAIEILEE
ncbi:MAG TPA: hypothetical protein VKZ74_05590 [Natronosporangium sp.]|nr:hypothetical protein [Natronosporangium sp.]